MINHDKTYIYIYIYNNNNDNNNGNNGNNDNQVSAPFRALPPAPARAVRERLMPVFTSCALF